MQQLISENNFWRILTAHFSSSFLVDAVMLTAPQPIKEISVSFLVNKIFIYSR